MNSDNTNIDFLQEIFNSQLEISKLQSINEEKIKSFIDCRLILGKKLIEINTSQYINECSMFRSDNTRDVLPNFDYINLHSDKQYFISDNNHIVEIYFEDTVKTHKLYFLREHSANQFVFELLFQSERVKNISKNIKFNLFRFVYYINTNKMTCRVLTD